MVLKKVDVGEIYGGARWVVVAHSLYPKIYCEKNLSFVLGLLQH